MAAEVLSRHQKSGMPGYIDRTPYATAYASNHTQIFLTQQEIDLLRHVNCGYLSTDGTPPTLLALKQHAQSLTVLIQKLCVTTTMGSIDNRGRDGLAFEPSEAFDWLNDLSKPYQNDDEWHHAPLISIMNVVESESELGGAVFHCPLQRYTAWATTGGTPPDGGVKVARPFATHHNLTMHANECLEILDHEYSAEGGFMGMIRPGDADHAAAARATLLGKFLLYTQNLVLRLHDIELNYANCLDALADEAAVPMQLGCASSISSMSGARAIAYPQDRWVLAQAGPETHAHVHRLLQREEELIAEKEKTWTKDGLMTDRMWIKEPNGDWVARGFVAVDITSRYFRLREQGSDATIFIMPAWSNNPASSRVRQLEKQPKAVTVTEPRWPQQVSMWEERFRSELDEAKRVAAEADKLRRQMRLYAQRRQNVDAELGRLTRLVELYECRDGADATAQIRDMQAALERAREEIEEMRKLMPGEAVRSARARQMRARGTSND